MALPAWWSVVTPHKDIRTGSFSEAVFAADLGDVLRGTAPEEYRDPRMFFKKTYVTCGLKILVDNVLSRLCTGKGDPVIQLQTPFGGGKTHALLALYHIVNAYDQINHMDQVKMLLDRYPDFHGAAVAAFVGTAADPIHGRTPWGEIAHQLGCYHIVKEHDIKRVAPGKDILKEILERSGPTLILMDEILQYIVKANQVERTEGITQGQTLAFLQELSEVVAASDNSVLVLTLPTSIMEQYDEEAEKALTQLQKVSGRVESIYVPVEGREIYEVIRKRLFEDLGDQKIHRQVAEEYFQLYQELGNDVPSEVRNTDYRDKIERAYPFHPEFIDVLYERWGSYPTFQRTRGVLRLLAQVIGDLYERKVSVPLIQSSIVDLAKAEVRHEFIKHIGNEYDSIIAADIIKKSVTIDREIGSEYEKYSITRGIATSVFLYSFSGGERRGITLPWLRVALLREGIPPTIVGDAISKLEDALWYFHTEKHIYSFKNQPNLNRVILDREETVGQEHVRECLHDNLRDLTRGAVFDTYLWPRDSGDIPDNQRLKLVLLDPGRKYGDAETERFAREILDNAGSIFRSYRNNLFILAMSVGAYADLERRIRRYLALKSISDDRGILTQNVMDELKGKLKQAEKDLPYGIVAAYRHVGWIGTTGIVWKDMGIPTVEQRPSIQGRVLQYLKYEERILSEDPGVSLDLILKNGMGRDEAEKPIREVYEIFLKTPGIPCLENEEVLLKAIKKGVSEKKIGARVGSKLYFGEPVSEISLEDIIVRPEKAEEEKNTVSGGAGHTPGKVNGPPYPPPPPPPETKVKVLSTKFTIPWDKLSDVILGVILPLSNCGANPEITIEISASSDNGFDRNTLDNKVRETLQQLNARIDRWDEK